MGACHNLIFGVLGIFFCNKSGSVGKMALTRDRATWLYALLARMEKPLHREECVGVRMVLRECCRRRWELGTREELALLNTLIAISGVYFEQGARSSASGPGGGGDGLNSLFSCRN